jgi:hypothetical protein
MSQDDHKELYLLLGRIDGKLDQSLARHDRMEARQDALEKRLTAMEKGRSWLLGGIAVVVFSVNLIKEWVWTILK